MTALFLDTTSYHANYLLIPIPGGQSMFSNGFFFLLLLNWAPVGQAALTNQDQVQTIIGQFQRQLALIEGVRHHIEEADLGQLNLLRNASRNALESIQDPNRGPINAATSRALYTVYIRYHYSRSYLDSVDGDAWENEIREVRTIADTIARAHGLNESPAVRQTHEVFSQMRTLLNQLRDRRLGADMSRRLEDLVARIGQDVLPLALANDDRPNTTDAARPVCRDIRLLYPDLVRAATPTNGVRELVIELQGLNEYYAEFCNLNGRRP